MRKVASWLLTWCTFATVLLGCSTIFDAREAQRAAQPFGEEGTGVDSPKPELRGLTLEQLVDFAMTNRPSVVSASLAVDDARLAMKEIRADAPVVSDSPWTAPKLNLSGSYSESNGGTKLSDAEFGTKRGDPSAALSLELLIWDFGRYDARARSQAENVIAAELNLIDEGYVVFKDVTSAYFTLLEKEALLEVAKTNESMCAVHLEQVEKRLEAGESKKLDVLRARLDLAQAKEKTVNSRQDVVTAGAELRRALGLDASQGQATELPVPEEGALDFVYRGFPDTDSTITETYSLARTNSPNLRIARAKLRGASASVDYAIANLFPELRASASFSWVDPLWYLQWGFSASQSVFQGFRKTTAVERAVVAMQSAATDIENAEQRLSLDLELALSARDNAKEALRTSEESLKRARENLELLNRQFEVGDVSRVEYTDSVAAYVEAMGSGVSAFYRGQRAEAAIYSLLGVAPRYEEKRIVKEQNQ